MARVSDGTNVPISPAPASSSNLGSPNGSLPDLEEVGGHPTSTMEEKSKPYLPKYLPISRPISQCWLQPPWLYRVSADLQTVSCLLHNQWHLSQTKLRTLNSLLTVSQLVSQPWRLVQPLAPGAPTRQDLGISLDIVMAPQLLGPSGPMAQGHRMTTGIQDVDLILFQALKTNMREVLSCYGSYVNSTTKGVQSGSILCGKGQTYQFTKNFSQFIAKQDPCRPDLYLKQEPHVSPLCCAKTTITVR